jgi:PPOX class probable F420-dependent enzyme
MSDPNATSVDLSVLRRLLGTDQGLCVVSLTRPDGTISSSMVNAGPLAHPVDGETVIGLVVAGSSYKSRRLRAQPRATITVTRGWKWQAVEGPVELIGPDDHLPGVALPALLRAVFQAAGGTHDDWDHFDRVMAEERRSAVLLRPRRVYGQGA